MTMEIIRKSDRASFIGQDKALVKEIASPRNTGMKNQSVAEVTIKPGDSVLEHYHIRSEELFYILEGEGLMTVEGESGSVGKGDAVAVFPGMAHKVKNTGDNDLVMLVMCSPSYCDEDQVISDNDSN